jgi:Spy/CpxP family protein refolding chaperone
MDIFAKNKLLKWCVAALLIINVLVLGAFFLKEYSQHNQRPIIPDDFRDVSGILQKELDLTPIQAEQMKKIRADFYAKEKLLSFTIRGERDSMNMIMFNKNRDDSLVKLLARDVAENEYKMELLRLEQAQQLKTICTPQQLEKFDKLVIEIRDYFRPDNRPPKNQ